jgi:hypothetical protein
MIINFGGHVKLPKVKGYTRRDRGKVITVPSYNRTSRPRGRKKIVKGEVNYLSDHIPTRGGKIIKLKKPIRIKYKPTRYKETGIFTDPKNKR